MDVLTAAINIVEDYPGGAVALAPQIGKAASTLSHELDRNYPGAKLGLADAVKLSKRTGDHRILHAFASACGCYVLPMPDLGAAASDDVMARVLRYTREFGDYLTAFADAMRDGLVTDNELQHCQRELGEMMRAAGEMMAVLQQSNLHNRGRASVVDLDAVRQA